MLEQKTNGKYGKTGVKIQEYLKITTLNENILLSDGEFAQFFVLLAQEAYINQQNESSRSELQPVFSGRRGLSTWLFGGGKQADGGASRRQQHSDIEDRPTNEPRAKFGGGTFFEAGETLIRRNQIFTVDENAEITWRFAFEVYLRTTFTMRLIWRKPELKSTQLRGLWMSCMGMVTSCSI